MEVCKPAKATKEPKAGLDFSDVAAFRSLTCRLPNQKRPLHPRQVNAECKCTRHHSTCFSETCAVSCVQAKAEKPAKAKAARFYRDSKEGKTCRKGRLVSDLSSAEVQPEPKPKAKVGPMKTRTCC